MALELKEAPAQEVAIYMPYFGRDQGRRMVLPYAISLYKMGELVGERVVEGGANVPFLATWRVANLPGDITLCRLIFDNDPDLSYEVQIVNSEFVNYLIDVVNLFREKAETDFPQVFYSKLFRVALASGDQG